MKMTLKMSERKFSKEESSKLIRRVELMRVVRYNESMFALVILEENMSSSRSIHQWLNEFEDVLPKKMPSGLPPTRGIQHQIDLVPKASLPNKPTYRCNLRRLRSCDDKWWSLYNSHVQFPTILVPKKDGSCRMCMGSRVINNITIKYQFPISRLDDMLDELHDA